MLKNPRSAPRDSAEKRKLPPESRSALERLIAEGRARPAEGDLLDLPVPSGKPTTAATRVLSESRAERL